MIKVKRLASVLEEQGIIVSEGAHVVSYVSSRKENVNKGN